MLQILLNLGPGFGTSQVFKQIEKILGERASKNQCKKIKQFEAKRGPKMRSKLLGKSQIFLNGPRRVVFRRSSFCYSKTMVREDSGLQKSSMQI